MEYLLIWCLGVRGWCLAIFSPFNLIPFLDGLLMYTSMIDFVFANWLTVFLVVFWSGFHSFYRKDLGLLSLSTSCPRPAGLLSSSGSVSLIFHCPLFFPSLRFHSCFSWWILGLVFPEEVCFRSLGWPWTQNLPESWDREPEHTQLCCDSNVCKVLGFIWGGQHKFQVLYFKQAY